MKTSQTRPPGNPVAFAASLGTPSPNPWVKSRGGAGWTRFHLPLIEPDGRFSRIRLSDKDWFEEFVMLSPAGSCVGGLAAAPDQALGTGIRWGSVCTPSPAACASYTAIGGAGP